jgi:hypothetical protein
MKNKKGALEFSFAWIFAIVAGVFIIFLAIYGVIKFINLNQMGIDVKTAKNIGVLINPIESSFESATRSMINTGTEIKIYTDCRAPTPTNVFGKQLIRTSNPNKEEEEEKINASFQNRYLFSENPVQGKTFYLFSKQLEVPFKVADLVYLLSTKDKYCFILPPNDIEDEINYLTKLESKEESEKMAQYENLFVVHSKTECPGGSINVCFASSTNCEIVVSVPSKSVKKEGKIMYYEGDALMYAAIFSSKEDYECQLKRLMGRTEELFKIYLDKSDFIFQGTGCNIDQELKGNLMLMSIALKEFSDSQDINVIYELAEQINAQNKFADCKLW